MSCAGSLRWSLAEQCDDQEEKGKLLRRSYRQLRLAVEQTSDQPLQRLMMGQVALDLAWLPGERTARRQLFAEACAHFAAATGVEPGLTGEVYSLWGHALVGCAALSEGAEWRNLITRAQERFAEAVQKAPDQSRPHQTAAHAWLLLAAESSAEEEQDAARRAADAARRANLVKPGSGDYSLACALSRLGQTAEAAEALAAALKRDPDVASAALRDPDLEHLWEARPELRQAIAAGRTLA